MSTMVAMLSLLPGIIFAAGAIWLASTGRPGWGWCIVGAILCGVSIKFRDGKDKGGKDKEAGGA